MSTMSTKSTEPEQQEETAGGAEQPQQQEEVKEELPILSVDVLRDVQSSHQFHGLRHGDYESYRKYCTRRLRRLRKSVRWTYGKRKFTWRELTPETTRTDRHLMVALVNAERCWSHAMQLKATYEAVKDTNPRPRFHYLRRLRKAKRWAATLETLSQARADEKTKLEAKAHARWLMATSDYEHERWEEALESFRASLTILQQLSRVGDPSYQSMCRMRVQTIEPAIRFCNYRLGREDDSPLPLSGAAATPEVQSMLQAFLEEQSKARADSLQEITWQGVLVPIRPEKLRVPLATAQSVTFQLTTAHGLSAKMALYDRLNIALNEADDILRSQVAKAGELLSAKDAAANKMLQEYSMHLRKTMAVQRLEALVEVACKRLEGSVTANASSAEVAEFLGASSRPRDIVRLYDAVLGHLKALEAFVVDDLDAGKMLLGRTLVAQANRMVYIALSFGELGKWPETLALLSRATVIAEEADHSLRDVATTPTELLDSLTRTQASIVVHSAVATAAAFGGAQSTSTDNATPDLLVSRDQWVDPLALATRAAEQSPEQPVSGMRLCDLPPAPRPLGPKPVLFDLALEGAAFPNLDARKKQKKGFFASLWG